jgi:hypothetical protein
MLASPPRQEFHGGLHSQQFQYAQAPVVHHPTPALANYPAAGVYPVAQQPHPQPVPAHQGHQVFPGGPSDLAQQQFQYSHAHVVHQPTPELANYLAAQQPYPQQVPAHQQFQYAQAPVVHHPTPALANYPAAWVYPAAQQPDMQQIPLYQNQPPPNASQQLHGRYAQGYAAHVALKTKAEETLQGLIGLVNKVASSKAVIDELKLLMGAGPEAVSAWLTDAHPHIDSNAAHAASSMNAANININSLESNIILAQKYIDAEKTLADLRVACAKTGDEVTILAGRFNTVVDEYQINPQGFFEKQLSMYQLKMDLEGKVEEVEGFLGGGEIDKAKQKTEEVKTILSELAEKVKESEIFVNSSVCFAQTRRDWQEFEGLSLQLNNMVRKNEISVGGQENISAHIRNLFDTLLEKGNKWQNDSKMESPNHDFLQQNFSEIQSWFDAFRTAIGDAKKTIDDVKLLNQSGHYGAEDLMVRFNKVSSLGVLSQSEMLPIEDAVGKLTQLLREATQEAQRHLFEGDIGGARQSLGNVEVHQRDLAQVVKKGEVLLKSKQGEALVKANEVEYATVTSKLDAAISHGDIAPQHRDDLLAAVGYGMERAQASVEVAQKSYGQEQIDGTDGAANKTIIEANQTKADIKELDQLIQGVSIKDTRLSSGGKKKARFIEDSPAEIIGGVLRVFDGAPKRTSKKPQHIENRDVMALVTSRHDKEGTKPADLEGGEARLIYNQVATNFLSENESAFITDEIQKDLEAEVKKILEKKDEGNEIAHANMLKNIKIIQENQNGQWLFGSAEPGSGLSDKPK